MKGLETVAVLFSSYAQVWQLAGGTVAVTVGESVERGFAPAEATLVDAGAGKTIDHELLPAAVSYIEDLFAQEGWRDLRAVKNGDYTFLPKELFHFKPNARWAEAYGYLAELLYPELNIHG